MGVGFCFSRWWGYSRIALLFSQKFVIFIILRIVFFLLVSSFPFSCMWIKCCDSICLFFLFFTIVYVL